jgi:EAL domain-containing protein (putative c-di-GMP-specific phosphodiesterase class I)
LRQKGWDGRSPLVGNKGLNFDNASVPAQRAEVLILARDPAVIAAGQAATQRVRAGPATLLRSGAEALHRLGRPGLGPRHLICEPGAAGHSWPDLLSSLTDPSSDTALILVAARPDAAAPEIPAWPADAARLADALRRPAAVPALVGGLPPGAAAALLAGLSNGEIAVRYQPVVRLADRRLLMVEALARWQRLQARISPAAFVPLAERSGLVRALSMFVASTAAADIAPLRQALTMRVSVNLPLALLLQPDLPAWLALALRGTGMRPRQMSIELTETTRVRDLSALRRGLLRLRAAGHPVLLDDIALLDGRDRLLDLPFAGFKLDRSLIEALPGSGWARSAARRLVLLAGRRGQPVIAEGVSDRRLWAAARALGVLGAQGFWVGRPMPAAELPGWAARWQVRPGG